MLDLVKKRVFEMFPQYSQRGAEGLLKLGLSGEVFSLKAEGGHLERPTEIAQTKDIVRRFLET